MQYKAVFRTNISNFKGAMPYATPYVALLFLYSYQPCPSGRRAFRLDYMRKPRKQ